MLVGHRRLKYPRHEKIEARRMDTNRAHFAYSGVVALLLLQSDFSLGQSWLPDRYVTQHTLDRAEVISLTLAHEEFVRQSPSPGIAGGMGTRITFDVIANLKGELAEGFWQYSPTSDSRRPRLTSLGPEQPTLLAIRNGEVIAYHRYLRPLSDEEIASLTLDNLVGHVVQDIAMARGPNARPRVYKRFPGLHRQVPGYEEKIESCTCEDDCSIRLVANIDVEGQPTAVELLDTPFTNACNELAKSLVRETVFVPATDSRGQPMEWSDLIIRIKIADRHWLFDAASEDTA